MSSPEPVKGTAATLTQRPITVLLVDDQMIVVEAVRRMLAGEKDIVFHFTTDPTKAIEKATEVSPTVILQDLVMPEVDGMTLAKFFRAHPGTKEVPLIVLSSKEEATTKAQAFSLGANDYLVKLPDAIELIARIRHHSKGYINLLERNEAYRKLEESQQQLAEEVSQAAAYVRSLLPAPWTKGAVLTDWRFVPSTSLGGDSLGYHWLDKEHLAFFLLDVSGHGVGAALLSVSAMNVLASQVLPNTDFRDPGKVLKGLNEMFPMEKHNNKYFTLWYGVFHQPTRVLRYSGGGHPPALLFNGGSTYTKLETNGPAVGFWDFDFETETRTLAPGSVIYLFSDGAFEIHKPDGKTWTYQEFADFLASLPGDGEVSPMDRALQHARELGQSEVLADDCSLLRVQL